VNIHTILDYLKTELGKLDAAITALEGSTPRLGRPPKSASGKRTMSPAARKRIAAAKKAWWAAKQKGKSGPTKPAAPAKKATSRKPMSPAARKKLSMLAKARWAEAKKAGEKAL
jgi:hypothetical protein